MKKIFVSFFNAIRDGENPNAMPCFYESFISGLKAANNEVLVYSIYQWNKIGKKCPEILLNRIKEFGPDLFIFFNNAFYDVSGEFDCPIIIYEVDSFLYYTNIEALKKHPNRYYYFVPQTDSIGILQKQLNISKDRSYYLPFFTEIHSDDTPQITNISFIGSKFTQNCKSSPWGGFMRVSPSQKDIILFRECIELIKQNPFLTKEALIKKLNITSEVVKEFLNVPSIISYVSDSNRIEVLSNIEDLGLNLYGTKNWASDINYDPGLTMSYQSKHVYSLKDNQFVYNSSKIGININHLQATSGFSWRVCDIMASNACLVSEYKPDFEKLFPNINIPLFHNKHEARELCVKLLNNETMRSDISQQCQEAIDQKYRFKHLLERIENILNMNLHSVKGKPATSVSGKDSVFINIKLKEIALPEFQLKKRLKLSLYLILLLFAQVPILDVLLRYKYRTKFLNKIKKYWR